MPVVVALACVAALIGIAMLAVAIVRSRLASALIYGATLAVSGVAMANALSHLALDPDALPAVVLPLGLPGLGAHFRIDALASFFLFVVNLGGALTSLYGLGYGRHEPHPARVLPFFPAFLAGMNLVVLADDAFSFLLSWEFMSLTSWAIVVAHHEVQANTRAGYIYLLMASFGTLCLLLAFGLLAGSGGDYAFAAIREADHTPMVAGLAFVLALAGTGSKAGLVPLHVWLPLAHPAAPSHVSALLSGVMTKVGVYGFIRIVFDLIGEPTAVVEPDRCWRSAASPRRSACSTRSCSTISSGCSPITRSRTSASSSSVSASRWRSAPTSMPWAAALALTAALFHVFNHSVFKSLLFFGAGAVLTATGERDMERLGGLIHACRRRRSPF